MSADALTMLIILIGMFAVLVWDRFPAWAVFMTTLTACMTLGLAPQTDLLKGFANPGVVTVAVLFVVAAGMYSTGAITLLANRLIGLPTSMRQAQTKIMLPIAAGSAFLNNTPLVAMMIPVIRDISRKSGLASSKLYMPLSFSSMLGGATTLIGTSVNLIIGGLIFARTGEQLNIFCPMLIGVPAAAAGILFLLTIGNRLLPEPPEDEAGAITKRRYRTDLVVTHGSPLEGKTVAASGLLKSTGYELVTVRRGDGSEADVDGELVLHGGDMLEFVAEADAVPTLWTVIGVEPPIGGMGADARRHENHLVEVVVSQHAGSIGRQLGELPTPDSPTDYRIIGVSKDGHAPDTPFRDIRIEAGDAGIMEVSSDFFYSNRLETEFALTKQLYGYQIQRIDRAIVAGLITGAMVLLAAFGVMSMLNAALLASLAMLLTGCITLRGAFDSIEWDTVVVLGAAVGLEAAVTGSGLSAAIAGALERVGGGNAIVAMTAVFIGAVVMTNVITNAAAAAFMFPISFSLAESLGVSVAPFVALLMLGCSYAFVNPAGYQTNLMVQKPGNYTFSDFMKVGLPLTLIVGIVALVLAPILYPL